MPLKPTPWISGLELASRSSIAIENSIELIASKRNLDTASADNDVALAAGVHRRSTPYNF